MQQCSPPPPCPMPPVVHEQQQRGGASSVEVYGFVSWIASFVVSGLFCAWALLPERLLAAAGVTYYPARAWALAVPGYLVASVLLGYWAYESLNMMSVRPIDAPTTLQDSTSKWVADTAAASIPPLTHLPAPLVSRVLYLQQQPARAAAELWGGAEKTHHHKNIEKHISRHALRQLTHHAGAQGPGPRIGFRTGHTHCQP